MQYCANKKTHYTDDVSEKRPTTNLELNSIFADSQWETPLALSPSTVPSPFPPLYPNDHRPPSCLLYCCRWRGCSVHNCRHCQQLTAAIIFSPQPPHKSPQVSKERSDVDNDVSPEGISLFFTRSRDNETSILSLRSLPMKRLSTRGGSHACHNVVISMQGCFLRNCNFRAGFIVELGGVGCSIAVDFFSLIAANLKGLGGL